MQKIAGIIHLLRFAINSITQNTSLTTNLTTVYKAPWIFSLVRGEMEVEEPSEKVETTDARGECELKTNNETPKQGNKKTNTSGNQFFDVRDIN